MGKKRKPPQPIKPAAGLQLVSAPAQPAHLGLNQAAADELRDLIRAINQRGRKKEKPSGDGELPPAA
jgi:hypothetical protein